MVSSVKADGHVRGGGSPEHISVMLVANGHRATRGALRSLDWRIALRGAAKFAEWRACGRAGAHFLFLSGQRAESRKSAFWRVKRPHNLLGKNSNYPKIMPIAFPTALPGDLHGFPGVFPIL